MILRMSGTKKVFLTFFDIAVSAVCGRRSWTNEMKMKQTITEPGKVTISDEAFVELLMVNYWERWKTNGAPKWTIAKAVNVHNHGWWKDGHKAFNEIYAWIKIQRKDRTQCNAVEALFKQRAVDAHAPNASNRTVGGVVADDDDVMVDDCD
jgi:predicted transglutaminase-like protease